MLRRIVLMLLTSACLWADATGTWKAQVVLDAGSGAATFTLKQEGEALSGTYAGTLGQASVRGTAKGDQVEWSFDLDQVGTVTFKGTVEGNAIKGTAQYGALGAGTFTATK